MSKCCMIEIAFNNIDEVNKVVDILLLKKLIASSHIIESKRSWNQKNERENDNEFLLQLKTKIDKQKEIYDVVKIIHSYDCFEFAVYEFNSINDDYLSWIENEIVQYV